MSVHTPGPWKSVAQIPETYSIESDSEVVAITALEGDTDLANARLLAAAPDLLHAAYLALEDLEQWVEALCGTEDERTLESLKALRHAIKKAEGR